MEELDAGGREERGQDPGMRRDVGHFRFARQGQAGRPREARGKKEPADQVFGLEELRVQGEGQGVPGADQTVALHEYVM